MRFCTKCGKESENFERFCSSCGSTFERIDQEASKTTDSDDEIISHHIEERSLKGTELNISNALRKKRKFAVFSFLLICTIFFIKIYISHSDDNYSKIEGNSFDNISNGGFAALEGNWIYYTYTDGLYKLNTIDGTSQKVSDGSFSYLNIIENHLYYINGSAEICRMDLWGTSSSLISKSRKYLSLIVLGEYIYANTGDCRLVRMKSDGTDEKLIAAYSPGEIEYVIYEDKDKIYTAVFDYSSMFSSKFPPDEKDIVISTVSKDSLSKDIIVKDKVREIKAYTFGPVHFDGKYIYYIDKQNRELMISSILSESIAPLIRERITNFNINKDNVYYRTEDNILHRVNLKDGSKILVSKDKGNNFCVEGDYIFYVQDENLFYMKYGETQGHYIGRFKP